MLTALICLGALICRAFVWLRKLLLRASFARFGRRYSPSAARGFCVQPKPEWVKREVIRLKALMPESGCRWIAHVFNRRFAACKKMTVGKTFVAETLRKHRYEIEVLRKKLKHAKPKAVPRNLVWAMDLTGKTDSSGTTHFLLGIIEHASRAALCLKALENKSSLNLLLHLIEAIKRYGKPKWVRTDNEAVFTSRLFRSGLFLLGIRHRPIDPGCPWQNGRIERFFGTLKEKLDQWEVASLEMLNATLGEFRFWYNFVRSHQNLDGGTPAEAWTGSDVFKQRHRQALWFEAWEGLLQGYYLRM